MLVKGNEPKRHHYIPQMILRNFTDENGKLWFWRREFDRGNVKDIEPKNIFVINNLYTKTLLDGAKDVKLEKFFANQESSVAEFIRQLAEIVRNDAIPTLNNGAWELWHDYFYYQISRTPGFITAITERSGSKAKIFAAIQELKKTEAAEGMTEGHEGLEQRIWKNGTLMAQGTGPGPEVRAALRSRGIVVYRIVDTSKSFIVGDVPGACAGIRGHLNTKSGKTLFIPLTHDISLAYMTEPRAVKVFTVDCDQIRQMNEATTARSRIIAGRSPKLISSLSKSVSYVGVVNTDKVSVEQP